MTRFFTLSDTCGLAVELEGGRVWVGVWKDPRELELGYFNSLAEAEQECSEHFGLSMKQIQNPYGIYIAGIFGQCMQAKPQAFEGCMDEYWLLRAVLKLDEQQPAEPELKAAGHNYTVNITGGVNNGVVARDVYGGINITDSQPPVVDGPWEQY